MLSQKSNFALCALLLLHGSLNLFGQMTTGTIAGLARDQTGAVLPGVSVTVRNVETGVVRTATTNQRGLYVVPNLHPGSYEVEAALAGFQTVRRRGITLTVGSEQVVDLELAVGAAAQTIEVTAELPVVETANSAMSGLVDETTIRDLPLNGRSFETLAVLQVGVAQYDFGVRDPNRGRGTQFSAAGSRHLQNQFLLDGVEMGTFGGGTPGSVAGVNLGVEAIREFQILTSTSPAEYGFQPGAVINAVSRSGTNSLHGSVYEYLRNSALDAKNFFDPAEKPIPPFKRNQFGFALGGPIRRDHVFFFGNYEGLRARTGLSNLAVVPSRTARSGVLPDGPVRIAEAIKPYVALYPDPNGEELTGGGALHFTSPSAPLREDYMMVRMDARLSDRDSLFVRYVLDDSEDRSPDVINLFNAINDGRRHHVVLGMERVFSPTVLNVFRAGLNRHRDDVLSVPINPIDPKLSFVPGEQFGRLSIGGGGGFGGASAGASGQFTFSPLGTHSFAPRNFGQNMFEYADTLHVSRGAHALKMGASLKRFQNNTYLTGGTKFGQHSFVSLRAFLEGIASTFSGLEQDGYPRGFRHWVWGFFFHDDYRVNSNLTLNLGLRWEFATEVTEVNGKISNILNPYTDSPETVAVGVGVRPKKKNIEPRIGFAWSMNSNKTAIRGGAGIYHEQMTPVVYSNYLGSLLPFHISRTVRNPGFPDATAGGTIQADPPGGSAREYDFHTPSKLQYNLNVQHEILPYTNFTVGYIGSQSRHLATARSINERTPTFLPDGTTFYPANQPFVNPKLGTMLYGCRCTSSGYNALVLSLRRLPQGPFGYQLSYTWSKSVDYASSIAGAEGLNSATSVMDVFNIRRDRGLSTFDVRHVFVANSTWTLPSTNLGGIGGAILNGWGLQGILTAASGNPAVALVGFNRSRSFRSSTGGWDRPDLAPGRSNNPVLGDPALYFDPTAFALPPAGFFGNVGRNTIIGPGRVNVDFSIGKGFALTEGTNLEFKSEFFNLCNTPHFGTPGVNIFSPSGATLPNAGKILNTVGTSRQIQFSLKLTF